MKRQARAPRHTRFWRNFWRDRSGNVMSMFALMLVPIIGVLGMAGEASGWYVLQRSAQNTADQAALAAAANGCLPSAGCATAGTTYSQEAAAVAARYNFVNGQDNTTVTPSIVTAPATPCASNTCYSVAIQHKTAIRLLGVVGFAGDGTISGGLAAQTISATAIARQTKSDSEFCITTLSNKSTAFQVNGAPNLDLSSCAIYAPNGGASCTNQAGSRVLGAWVSNAGKSNDNCGSEHNNPLPPLDPYSSLASKLPNASSACSNFNGVTISGSQSFSLSAPKCGNVTLSADVTVTGNSVLVIENGHLDLHGHKLMTASNASLTIIFSGTTSSNNDHFICSTQQGTCSNQNGSVLDYSAPTSGDWSGVAIYQDPSLTKNLDFTYSGNSPAFNVTGMVYAPKANVSLSGAINHATQGLACLSFMVNTVLVNGTASLFATPTIDCKQAGINPNSVQTLPKVVMVQ